MYMYTFCIYDAVVLTLEKYIPLILLFYLTYQKGTKEKHLP